MHKNFRRPGYLGPSRRAYTKSPYQCQYVIDAFTALIGQFLPRDAMLARYMPYSRVCLSVCHKWVFYTETAKRMITQTTPHDSPGTLVFCCRRSRQTRTQLPPTEAPNAGGVG